MPVRVLWLVKGLGPGGTERLLLAVAAHLPPDIVPTVGYVVPEKDALVADLRALGVDVRRLGGDRHWARALRREVRSGDYDIVHAHSPMLAAAARVAAMGRRRPRLVTTEHNAWSTFAVPTRVANAITAPLDDAVIAVSREVRDSIWWRSLRRRCEVLVHGVDLTALRIDASDRAGARRELGVAADEVLIVTVANYRRQKAYLNLLRAARQVLDRSPGVRFAAVGQGPLEAEVHGIHAELGLDDRFALLGYRSDVHRILAAADAFVLASDFEGLPVALMEAMATGLPVVATAVGGIPDVITNGVEGLLVPPRDPAALAGALIRVAADPGIRASLAARAVERSEIFDVRRVSGRLASLYAELHAK